MEYNTLGVRYVDVDLVATTTSWPLTEVASTRDKVATFLIEVASAISIYAAIVVLE